MKRRPSLILWIITFLPMSALAIAWVRAGFVTDTFEYFVARRTPKNLHHARIPAGDG